MQERWASTWDDDTRGPRNGCVRAYGCNNHLEDIATMVEAVYALGPSDDFFKKLIKEDPRYKQKLDLLREYHFISEERYKMAVGEEKK